MSKTKITLTQVQHVAKLARLPLTVKRSKKLQPQLSEVLDYVSQIGSINTKNDPETCQVIDHYNTFRRDKIEKHRVLTQKQALSNAPKTYQGYVVVPALIDKS